MNNKQAKLDDKKNEICEKIDKIKRQKCALLNKRIEKQIEVTKLMKEQFKIFESKIDVAKKEKLIEQKNKFFDSMKKQTDIDSMKEQMDTDSMKEQIDTDSMNKQTNTSSRTSTWAKICYFCECIKNTCDGNYTRTTISGRQSTTIINGKLYTHSSNSLIINNVLIDFKGLDTQEETENMANIDVLEEFFYFLMSMEMYC